jgi:flagellar biosynthetic protein FliQ
VSPDQATGLLVALLRTTLLVAGPVLAVALVAGLVVGVLQTATQINEASISFLAKVGAVLVLAVVLGPHLASYLVSYTRSTFEGIALVVR